MDLWVLSWFFFLPVFLLRVSLCFSSVVTELGAGDYGLFLGRFLLGDKGSLVVKVLFRGGCLKV
jgi:hypothetical protein